MGCGVGRAAEHVAAANQDLCLSHVTRMDGVSVWRAWAETNVTTVVVVTMVSMATAAQVNNSKGNVGLTADSSTLWSLIGYDLFFSQHALVITRVGTATQRLESASAPPTQRGTPATGVRQVTGVTTQPWAARYTQKYTQTHTRKEDDTCDRCDRCVTSCSVLSHAAAAQQEAPPLSVTSPTANVGAGRASLAGHVTNVHLVTMVTQHAQRAAATWREQKGSSATQRWECATVDTVECVCAR